MSERMSLLEFLKERSGIRLSKLEAYLDLVDKASVQYIPKDLCLQGRPAPARISHFLPFQWEVSSAFEK